MLTDLPRRKVTDLSWLVPVVEIAQKSERARGSPSSVVTAGDRKLPEELPVSLKAREGRLKVLLRF